MTSEIDLSKPTRVKLKPRHVLQRHYSTSDFYIALAKRVRELRQTCGLTQAVVAEALSMSKSNYINIEAGRVQLQVHHLAVLSELLRCSQGELLKESTQ